MPRLQYPASCLVREEGERGGRERRERERREGERGGRERREGEGRERGKDKNEAQFPSYFLHSYTNTNTMLAFSQYSNYRYMTV